jgi:hypothetical protein
MKKGILLAIVFSAFLTTLLASSVYACGDGSNEIVLVNGELPGGG